LQQLVNAVIRAPRSPKRTRSHDGGTSRECGLAELDVAALTSKTLKKWHAALADPPCRLRTRKTASQQNFCEIDPDDPDAIRRRRATANRILTVLKAALNLGSGGARRRERCTTAYARRLRISNGRWMFA
jgi:hypothetical protein